MLPHADLRLSPGTAPSTPLLYFLRPMPRTGTALIRVHAQVFKNKYVR